MHATSASPENLVGIATIVKILQRSRASIYRDIENKTLPKPLKLGSSSRWRVSEVAAVNERLSDDLSMTDRTMNAGGLALSSVHNQVAAHAKRSSKAGQAGVSCRARPFRTWWRTAAGSLRRYSGPDASGGG